ncbi:CPBP family intramembrane glutamic endopeptidase [Dyadobacter psychrotolerans]|uniref:CPBP family intramembrane metalloprotease n=1 Tax=Dyadobacter psychrotolerans TaxID=2541721 RepID=A0A4R5DKM2_9BACT|nr:CPBP family intramembrane glutamic endopeptidase [Dyadobacter psychrotolerans]TDE12521.1 CPBP family intramembrane metalloprotease [Dyadobacter psychrotolerans]
MILHLKYLIFRFANFIRNPNNPNYKLMSIRQKLLDVGVYYLFFSFVVCTYFGLIILVLEELHVVNELEHVYKNHNLWKRALGAIILAPILEEALFRFPIGRLRMKPWFRWLFYSSALIFGWIHFFNYQLVTSNYMFFPLITLPQTFFGFLLGYIRMLYGFWFAVMLHLLYNALGIGLSFIFD